MATSGDGKRPKARLGKRTVAAVKDAGFSGAALGGFLGGLAGQLLKGVGPEPEVPALNATHERRMRARSVAMGLLREFSREMAPHHTARFLDRVEKELLKFDAPSLSVSVSERGGKSVPNRHAWPSYQGGASNASLECGATRPGELHSPCVRPKGHETFSPAHEDSLNFTWRTP